MLQNCQRGADLQSGNEFEAREEVAVLLKSLVILKPNYERRHDFATINELFFNEKRIKGTVPLVTIRRIVYVSTPDLYEKDDDYVDLQQMTDRASALCLTAALIETLPAGLDR
jgi:hypothetical protein